MNTKITIALALALALGACNRRPTPQREEVEPSPAAASQAAEATGPTLYELEITLTDQDGRTLGLDTFKGSPVIVSMFYSSCPYACPMLLSDIKKQLAALDPSVRDEVRVLLVSLDPERDTPAAMKKLAEAHHVDTPSWRFTSAPESRVRELAAVLGIKYNKLENGAINHSSVITVLDRRGAVRYKSESLGKPDPAVSRELFNVAKTPLAG